MVTVLLAAMTISVAPIPLWNNTRIGMSISEIQQLYPKVKAVAGGCASGSAKAKYEIFNSVIFPQQSNPNILFIFDCNKGLESVEVRHIGQESAYTVALKSKYGLPVFVGDRDAFFWKEYIYSSRTTLIQAKFNPQGDGFVTLIYSGKASMPNV